VLPAKERKEIARTLRGKAAVPTGVVELEGWRVPSSAFDAARVDGRGLSY
jgi:hypothetical protein